MVSWFGVATALGWVWGGRAGVGGVPHHIARAPRGALVFLVTSDLREMTATRRPVITSNLHYAPPCAKPANHHDTPHQRRAFSPPAHLDGGTPGRAGAGGRMSRIEEIKIILLINDDVTSDDQLRVCVITASTTASHQSARFC